MSTVQELVGRKSNDRLVTYQWHCYGFRYVTGAYFVH